MPSLAGGRPPLCVETIRVPKLTEPNRVLERGLGLWGDGIEVPGAGETLQLTHGHALTWRPACRWRARSIGRARQAPKVRYQPTLMQLLPQRGRGVRGLGDEELQILGPELGQNHGLPLGGFPYVVSRLASVPRDARDGRQRGSLAVHHAVDGGPTPVQPCTVFLSVGVAGLEHALLDGVVVRLQPTRVVALQVGEQVHNEGFVARYQKVLVHGARRPEGVHLLPYFLVLGVPASAKPELRVLVHNSPVLHPAALHDMVPGRTRDGVVGTCPKHLVQELCDDKAVQSLLHVHVEEPPPVPVRAGDVGIVAFEVGHVLRCPLVRRTQLMQIHLQVHRGRLEVLCGVSAEYFDVFRSRVDFCRPATSRRSLGHRAFDILMGFWFRIPGKICSKQKLRLSQKHEQQPTRQQQRSPWKKPPGAHGGVSAPRHSWNATNR
mmetsp:Transcript_46300/g.88359  ORF Transcript_46300/g.88359 Transcript_46300/m.88359 type:complete len:435 (-) Transcript_46300:449-1753(-)